MSKSFGGLLRAFRLEAGLTQEDLATRSGLSPRTIRGMESGRGNRPRQTSVRLIGDALGLDEDRRRQLVRAAVASDVRSSTSHAQHSIGLLPRDITDFTGRTSEYYRLVGALTAPRPAMMACGIDGMAGVGKSALAIHIAHQVADAFPDAVLFVDLHGHTAGRSPRMAVETLGHLLRVMGARADRIPAELDDLVALWRTLTMDRRVLLLLDDAVSAEQVRPVLPSGADCSVVITSRRRLTDLDMAHTLSLDPMPVVDATKLFCRASGVQVADAGVREVVDLCAGLPLATRIAGARLRHRHAWSAAELADRLRDEDRRLSELTIGDRGVPVAFSLSYQCLTELQRRVFRSLGVHPGQWADVRSVAASCELPMHTTETVLEDLLDANLLAQPVTGRYRLHDLLRAFARDQAAHHSAERDATLRRTLSYYLGAADSADRRAYPHRQRVDMPVAVKGVPTFGSAATALDWFDAEISTIVAATRIAYESGLDDYAWRIPVAAWGCFSLRSRWTEWIDSHQVAVAAAERVRDNAALGQALSGLGVAMAETARYDSAIACYQRAIELRREIRDVRGEASNLGNLAVVHAEMGRYDQAIECGERAADRSRSIGDHAREAATLTNLGEMRRRVGQFTAAVSNLEAALVLSRRISDSHSESIALGYLAAVHNDLRNHAQADEFGRRALHLLEHTTRDRLRIADVLIALGHAARGLGATDTTRLRWQRAFDILTDLGHKRTREVAKLLDSLSSPVRSVRSRGYQPH